MIDEIAPGGGSRERIACFWGYVGDLRPEDLFRWSKFPIGIPELEGMVVLAREKSM